MTGFVTADGADYLMNLFGGVETTVPEYYLALVTAPVGTAEAGVELTEPTEGDYSRSAITTGPENWVVMYGALTNITEVTLPVAGTGGWTGIIGWALCDAAIEGRALYAGDSEPYDVAEGEQVTFPAGSITISIEMESWRETT